MSSPLTFSTLSPAGEFSRRARIIVNNGTLAWANEACRSCRAMLPLTPSGLKRKDRSSRRIGSSPAMSAKGCPRHAAEANWARGLLDQILGAGDAVGPHREGQRFGVKGPADHIVVQVADRLLDGYTGLT